MPSVLDLISLECQVFWISFHSKAKCSGSFSSHFTWMPALEASPDDIANSSASIKKQKNLVSDLSWANFDQKTFHLRIDESFDAILKLYIGSFRSQTSLEHLHKYPWYGTRGCKWHSPVNTGPSKMVYYILQYIGTHPPMYRSLSFYIDFVSYLPICLCYKTRRRSRLKIEFISASSKVSDWTINQCWGFRIWNVT